MCILLVGIFKEEIDDVELADDIELEEHNGDTHSTELARGIGMITNPLEDTTSNINVSILFKRGNDTYIFRPRAGVRVVGKKMYTMWQPQK